MTSSASAMQGMHTRGSATVTFEVLGTADQAKRDAGGNMGDERDADEKRLGQACLIDLTGEEEV